MMIGHRGPPQPGDPITTGLVSDLIQGAKQVQGITSDTGVSVYEDGVVINPPHVPLYAADARQIADDTFVAQIQPKGPSGQEDFADSRYWVREIFETSPLVVPPAEPPDPPPPPDYEKRPRWLLDINDAMEKATPDWPEPGDEDYVPPPRYATRYVVATNLAEFQTDDADGEGHQLGVTEKEPPEGADPDDPIDHGGALVHVFAVCSGDGPPRFFFTSATGGGGGTEWGIVRHVPNEEEPYLEVTPVRILDESPWAELPENTSKTYRTEPGTLGLHYAQWVWTGGAEDVYPKPVTAGMVVLPIISHGDKQFVSHHSRLWYPVPLPDTLIHTDCYLTAGGGQLELRYG